jgi:uncharacterized protein DUF397
MEGTSALSWRKSSYSGNNGGNCVEVGTAPGSVAVRDTTNRDGGTLAFSPETWRVFTVKIATVD